MDRAPDVLGNPEKICPGRHVKQNEWQPEWNDMYLPPNGEGSRYDYISDYECIFNHPVSHAGSKQEHWKKLQDAKTRLGGTTMQIRELAYFTNPEAADQIVNDHGFRAGLKKINKDENDDDIIANLSWWSPIFTEDERKNVREHLAEVIKPFTEEREDDLDALKNQFATSDAFQPNPLRYGNHLFQYEINELCDHYSQLNLSMASRVTKYWERLVTSRRLTRLSILFLYVAKQIAPGSLNATPMFYSQWKISTVKLS